MQQLFSYQTLMMSSVGVLVLIWLLYRLLHQNKGIQSQIDRVLAPHQRKNIKQVLIPDGLGGIIEIEQLVLLPQGIVVLQTYPISGQLFGAEKIDQWTQLVDGRSYKFSNPLNHLRNIQQSLKMISPKMPVMTFAIFTADSHFPKGKPKNVTIMSRLKEDVAPLFEQTSLAEQQLQRYWYPIARIARKNGVALSEEAL